MTLNAILRWLKPHEMIFFDLLEASAENIYQAIQYFDREIRVGDAAHWPELRRQMKEYEHTGDEFTHEIIDRLDKTFVTPIEREDILALAHSLDDVVDICDAICERLVLYRIDTMRPAVMEISSLAVEGARELTFLIRSLRNMSDTRDIRLHIRRVHVLENQADSVYHSALAELFKDPKDPIELMKWKELLDHIENATDRIELVAKVIGSTVMRNA
jgi:predicted phosphate transport protein (TIGR00153 family)